MLRSRIVLSVVALVIAFAGVAAAEEKVVDNCKVVKVEGDRLFITKDGNEHSAPVASDAKLTIDGKDAKVSELKSGMTVKLTINKNDGNIQILRVEASSK